MTSSKCVSTKQEIHFSELTWEVNQSVNEIWPVYVTLQKKTFYQSFRQKLQPEN